MIQPTEIAIISENKHAYDIARPNRKGKIIRFIPINGIISPNNLGGKTVHVQNCVRLEDKSIIILSQDVYIYSKEEVDGFFKILNNPLFPNESYTNEHNKMYITLLLQETKSVNLYNDNFIIYEKNKRISKKNN